MKRIFAILWVAALFFGGFSTVYASPPKKATISGTIVDESSGKPIEYANLVLLNPADSNFLTGTITNADGSFIIDNIEKGSYKLNIHFIGYQTITIENLKIQTKRDEIDLGQIKLQAESIMLGEAEIVANNDYIDFKIDKKVINVSEHINAEGAAVLEALHNVPSVQVDASGSVSLRGSSSFTLLIDGRPSVMEPSDALNQIQASSVEKIEVITNPSVKYDAAGTSGIINLIMKKQKSAGTSGQVAATLATGNKYSASMMVNKRAKKITTHLGGAYSNKRKQTESTDDREVYNGDTTFFENIASDRDIYRRNYKINGGLVYDADEHNSYSFNAEIGQWEFDRSIDSKIRMYNNFQPDDRLLRANEEFLVTNKYLNGDVGYRHLFNKEGHQIDAYLYYSRLDNETPNNIGRYDIGVDGNVIPKTIKYLNLQSIATRQHFRIKTDYTLPVSKNLILDVGYQNDSKKSDNKYTYKYRLDLGEDWNTDSTLSGEMDFSRQINAVYASVGTQVKGIDIQGGVRMEIANRLLEQKLLQNEYNYNDVNLFPSVHLSKSLENDRQITLSYSRRITRPNQWMLLPALNSTGRNMLQMGNPELMPDFTDSWELGYNMRNQTLMLSTELYIRNTKNAITTTTSETNGIFYQSYENLDRELSGGIDVMGNINIAAWWRMNISANVYYYKINGTLKSGYDVDNSSLAWNGRFKTTFIVKKKTFLEFMTVYYGPSILPQGKVRDFYYFDFFVKRNFFNRKLTVALRSHNTFDTGIYIEDSEDTNFKAHTWFKYEGPTFMITLTYRLNNYKRKRSNNNMDMNYDSGLDH